VATNAAPGTAGDYQRRRISPVLKGRSPTHKPGDGRRGRLLCFEPLEDRTLLATGSLTLGSAAMPAVLSAPLPLAIPLAGGTNIPVGLVPAQIEQAYGYNTIDFAGGIQGTGAGQTIAIVDAYRDPNITGDLASFDQTFGITPNPVLTITPVGSVPQAPTSTSAGVLWAEETALDVEWAHALAPDASILLVETPDTDAGLISGVNYARSQPGVSVISMSWTETSVINNAVFTSPSSAQGITFVAGTGDDGAAAGYPASSPNVLAVGGTQFATPPDASGDYPPAGETAWSGSSGGIDSSQPQSFAQQLAVGAEGGRAAPDVAFDAGSDVAVYDSYDFGSTPWVSVFGTSIGAPAWAALVAIADQGRVLDGETTLDGSTQTIPDLYAIARAGNESAAFNDITSGSNSSGIQATSGYDVVTGLGTPKAAVIAATLSQNTAGLTLIAPGPGAVVTSTTPVFEWSTVAGAVSYSLTVTDTVTGKVVISQPGLTGTSYTPPAGTPLTSGDAFTWDVTAVTAETQATLSPAPASGFAIIAIPAPVGPSGTADSTMPLFTWSNIAGAAGYDLQVFDTTIGLTVINAQDITNNSYTPIAALTNLDTFEWTVSAYIKSTYQELPYVGPPSTPVYFTVDGVSAPALITPANDAVETTLNPTFEWSSVGGAVSYTATIVDSGGYPVTSQTVSVSGTSFVLSSPLAYGFYQWSVQAFVEIDGVTTPSPVSQTSSFFVSEEGQPTLISPNPGETVTTTTPVLQWSPIPGQANAPVLLNLFDVTASFTVLSNLEWYGTSFTVRVPLDNGHTYQWSAATLPDGPTAEFTVSVPNGGTESLATPKLTGPSGLIDTDTQTFQWSPVAGATEYGLTLLNVSNDSTDWAPPILVNGTSFTETVQDYKAFLWQVTAFDSSGNFSLPSNGLDFFASDPANIQLPGPTGLAPSGVVSTYTPTALMLTRSRSSTKPTESKHSTPASATRPRFSLGGVHRAVATFSPS
jgi:hypothetical protein